MLSIPLSELPVSFRAQALHWAAEFTYCAYFEPSGLSYPQGAFRQLLAVATDASAGPASLAELRPWLQQPTTAPRCGFLTYEVKDEIEALSSSHPTGLAWPMLHFFHASAWLCWQANTVEIYVAPDATDALTPAAVFQQIIATPLPFATPPTGVALQPRFPRPDYLAAVRAVQEDILNGEVYELNLCQEFTAEGVHLDPVDVFLRLNAASPTPFAGFYRHQQQFLLCASPERFLRREGSTLLSQPIKGTSRRGTTPAEDDAQRLALLHNEKERAENLMIVDLVRNDLARVAQPGSVQVPQLFGLYPFQHVWQMISSVQAQAQPTADVVDLLRATFPMGSMTGAPKIRAMQLIEHYEHSRRGLYSGSIGYLLPNGDFDFNVVIRSLQYRPDTGHVSFQVGSAITYDSVPEHEYEECLLKARALLAVLGVTRE
ncbi:aminodeoxychorismate synthase component I [Hymenobacter sp. AT01-02]|uniref:aminodeoxychorismate synthase component I n=1 Tax=Hymenobacter sp. AT01-02 TaxID=1571877 RepID=UPI0005F11682|nr:aminodeoxychorismate synthase component I [Hymenobacter sp. AT01-02]